MSTIINVFDGLWDMKDGWMNGQGIAPNPTELEWLSKMFNQHYTCDQLPDAYPTLEGNIMFEWSIDTWEIRIEINLNTHIGDCGRYNTYTKLDEEKTIDLNNPEDWKWLSNQIQTLIK